MSEPKFDLLMLVSYIVLDLVNAEETEEAKELSDTLKDYIKKAAEDE